MTLFDRNNTSYSIQIYNSLKIVLEEYNKKNDPYSSFLQYYQYFIRRFMCDPEFGIDSHILPQLSYSRGLLIYHSMGMGKTYLAIAVALSLIDLYTPLILLPKSLQLNFKHSIYKLVELLNPNSSKEELIHLKGKMMSKFTFMSSNANNIGAKIGARNLNNRLIIVDEAHNLFRSIISSGGKDTNNAKQIYDAIMGAKNCKILFLSGTPCSKDPFELVPCFNMLTGFELLPPQYSIWTESFIAKDGKSMVNLNKLANRLFGLVSFAELKDASIFPQELPIKLEYVEMSTEQYHKYLLAREREKSESIETNSKQSNINPSLSLPSSDTLGSYYVKSRMLGNYAELTGDGDSSPKITKLVENIEQSPGSVIVYSQFIKGGGLQSVANKLISKGYEKFNIKKINTNIILKKSDPEPEFEVPKLEIIESKVTKPEVTEQVGGSSNIFAFITGEVSEDDQKQIVKVFNSKDNVTGSLIKVLLLSKTGSEGLSLKCVRQVHILEPYWDYSRINQVIARAVRLGSHLNLPEADRTVQPFIYFSIANKKIWDAMPENNRSLVEIDQLFYERAMEKEKLNNEVRNMLKDISIECQILELPTCRVCKPTNTMLFTKNIRNDLKNKDPCEKSEEIELDLEEIIYKDTKYYWYKDSSSPIGYYFYRFDNLLNANVVIDLSDPIINELLELVETI